MITSRSISPEIDRHDPLDDFVDGPLFVVDRDDDRQFHRAIELVIGNWVIW